MQMRYWLYVLSFTNIKDMNKQTFRVLMDLSIFSSLKLQTSVLIRVNATINNHTKLQQSIILLRHYKTPVAVHIDSQNSLLKGTNIKLIA